MELPKLSIIIPSYNEAEAIPVVLNDIASVQQDQATMARLPNFETIVVDDGSHDSSVSLLRQHSWVEAIVHNSNRGYGAAIKTGIAAAKGEYIAFMDMDATYHVPDLFSFYELIQISGVDMIVGDRRHNHEGMPRVRRIGNAFFSTLASLVLSHEIRDCASGIRVVRGDLFRQIAPYLPDTLDFALALTLTMIQLQRPFLERPTVYKKRVGGSKLSEVQDGLRFLNCILSHKWQNQTRFLANLD